MNNIKYVRKISLNFLTFVFLIAAFVATQTKAEYKTPDFAYPQSVLSRSDSLLNNSIEKGDDEMALRAFLNRAIALNLLTDSDVPSAAVNSLDTLILKLSPEFSPLGYLLKADILKEVYKAKKNIYDSRQLPVAYPFPENISEWNSEMFKTAIIASVDSALQKNNYCKHSPVEKIALLLSETESSKQLNLSIEDFIILKSIKILKSIGSTQSETIIPFFKNDLKNKTLSEKAWMKAKRLSIQFIDKNKDNSDLRAIGVVEYVGFLDQDEALKKLISELDFFSSSSGEGIILKELWERGGYDSDMSQRSFYKKITDNLEKYPNSYASSSLKYIKSILSRQYISIEVPNLILPDSSFSIKVKMDNRDKGYVLLYKLNDKEYDNQDRLVLKNFSSSKKPIQIFEVEGKGEIPFSIDKEIILSGLKPGVYIVIPSNISKLSKDWNKNSGYSSYSTFRITDISIVCSYDSNEKNSGKVYVVSAKDQHPITGADVWLFERNDKKAKYILKTGKDGSVDVATGTYRIEAVFGKSMARSDFGYGYYPKSRKPVIHTSILTDLAVYRPGDTVGFAVIGWMQTEDRNNFLCDSVVSVTLRDVNYREAGKIKLRFDKFGRCNGKLKIPGGKLTGIYRLTSELDGFRQSVGSTEFMVSEYKLPLFKVSLEKDSLSDQEIQNTLIFKGNALTFSGMPVSNAEVNVKIEYLPWFGIRNLYSPASCYYNTHTDAMGNFSVVLPTDGLKGSRFERGKYRMIATVTADDGDSEPSQPLYFYLGTQNTIRPEISDKINLTGDSLKIYVPVYDIMGLPKKTNVKYRITEISNDNNVLTGEFLSPTLIINSNLIVSGKYRFEFYSDDENTYNYVCESVIWRESDIQVPYETPLWIPRNEYIYNSDEKEVDIAFGSYWRGSSLLCMVGDKNGLVKRVWITTDSCLNHLKLDVQNQNEEVYITLSGLHDFQSKTETIKLIPAKRLEKMVMKVISFRDNITVGDHEKWSFRFSIGENNIGVIPVLAVMSDKALNSINEFKWNINVPDYNNFNSAHIRNPYYGLNITNRYFSKIDGKFAIPSILPDWNTYGYPLIGYVIRMGEIRNYKMAMSVKSESAVLASSRAMDDTAAEMIAEESQVTGNAMPVEEEKEEIEYRPVEMPLAFFKPDLTTNNNGELNIDFLVPNFNTTWQLQVLGYDSLLNTTSIIKDAIASKLVMARLNLPKYFRTGDKGSISATFYNNNTEVLEIDGSIEIFDPITREILGETVITGERVKPYEHIVLTCKVNVPPYLMAIGVRTLASKGNFSDGEQGFVPVYPASLPIIESKTFFLNSNQEEIEVDLPKFNKNANITLKFTNNPIWEVLLSLPSLKKPSDKSVLSFAKSLYAALIGRDIVLSNPEVAERLRKILDSEDKTLTKSNLEKDENLKSVYLDQTPWVNDACVETAKISSLGYLLESEEIESIISDNIKRMRNLQKSDGGFTWFEGMNSSPFITSEIIGLLGWLNGRNLLDYELKQIGERAVKYHDRWLVDLKKQNKRLNNISVLNYLYNRSGFDISLKGDMNKIKDDCIEQILSDWRYFSISQKAKSAIVVWRLTENKGLAREIIKSLHEFLGRQHSLQDLAILLDAFNEITPDTEGVEKVRELLLLKKETEMWGDKSSDAVVIHSILTSIDKNVFIEELPNISIGEKEVQLSKSQALIGCFTVDLDSKLLGKKLKINRKGGVPAWGGVIAQYEQPVKDVKASSVKDLSVTKNVYLFDKDGKAKKANKLNRGDKVLVSLNLTVGKDMEYVALIDNRAACLQPLDWNSGICMIDGLLGYREIGAENTSFFVERLPKGEYIISYEYNVDREGEYSLGIASVQSLYSPIENAHSAGNKLSVEH